MAIVHLLSGPIDTTLTQHEAVHRIAGTVESISRAASKHSGKILVTSCQSNFGPKCGAASVVNILPAAVKQSGVAARLLLAEAGLIFLRGPEADLKGINPIIRVIYWNQALHRLALQAQYQV